MKRTVPGEQFAKMPRELLESAAWRSTGINGRRILDFLLLEHMRQGGRRNGLLKAPHRQLVECGVHPALVAPATRELEELGLIDCHRAGMRVAAAYTINWLARHDGTMPSARWKDAPGAAYRSVGRANGKSKESAYRSVGSAAYRSVGRSAKSAFKSVGR